MGLKDLKTDLKSLKFGGDTVGGGSSKQPYIQKEIPSSLTVNTIDFPVRGGALAVIRAAEDTIRIGKFFADPSKGPFFIAKQVGLQLTNPNLHTAKQLGIENTRIYNLGLNTLAQIPAGGFGVHFDRHGLSPIMSEKDKYEYYVAQKNRDGNNRLFNLVRDFYSTDADSENGPGSFATVDPRRKNIIYDYVGGPNSVYGIGRTTIRRYTPTNIDNNGNLILNIYSASYKTLDVIRANDKPIVNWSNTVNVLDKYNTYFATGSIYRLNVDEKSGLNPSDGYTTVPAQIYNQASFPNARSPFSSTLTYERLLDKRSGSLALSEITDFRSGVEDKSVPSTDYRTYNMETRIGIGNPGILGRDRTSISKKNPATVDKVNLIPLNDWALNNEKNKDKRDLIKFMFEAIDSNVPNSNKTIKMIFRAFLTGGISDSFKANWKSNKYSGRGEEFWTYDGFGRSLSFTFKIAAQSRVEMKTIYQKLNYLVSNTAPQYGEDTGFMRGSFIRMTIGNWLYRQPGILNGLEVKIEGDTPWEIAMSEPEGGSDTTMNELPHIVVVSVNFTPIHDFLPEKDIKAGFLDLGRSEIGTNHDWMKGDVLNEIPNLNN